MVIKQPFIFPKDLYLLTVHGHIHHSQEYVWLNLPPMQDISAELFELKNVGKIASLPDAPSWWEETLTWVESLFSSPDTRRVAEL